MHAIKLGDAMKVGVMRFIISINIKDDEISKGESKVP